MPIGAFRLNGLSKYNPPSTASSYSFVDSSYSTVSTTITMPSSLLANDLAVMFDTQANSNTTVPTAVTPSGWTNISNNVTNSTTNGIRICVSYKLLDGTESGTSITGMTAGSLRGEKKIAVFRPNNPIASVSLSTINGQATLSAPTNQTLTMSGSTGPYIGFAWYFSTGSITTRGSTVTETREIGTTGTTPRGFLKTFEATDSTISFSNSTISMADYGANAMLSFRMDIT